MCEALSIQLSGFYAWVDKPKSKRQLEDERLMGLIKHSWLESGCVYGYRKVTSDLKDLGEACSKHRVAKLMKLEGIKAQVGYKKHKGHFSGKPAVVADNVLDRQFTVTQPNRYWVTDITYIRTQGIQALPLSCTQQTLHGSLRYSGTASSSMAKKTQESSAHTLRSRESIYRL